MDFDSTFAAINPYGGVDYAPHNKGVTPVFFVEPIVDEAASEQKGRKVYRDMERVRIYIAGDSLSAATHPVDAGIIARFHDQYAAWKRNKKGDHIVGTPLSKWPMATPGLIRELEAVNVFSVEDLAAVSDGNIQNITNGRSIREKAIAWLKSSQDHGAAMKYAAEAERLRDDLKEAMKRIAALEKDGLRVRSLKQDIEIEAIENDDAYQRREEALEVQLKEAKSRTAAPRKKAKAKKDRRKSAWTPERRKAASEAVKARGGVGVPKLVTINAGENSGEVTALGTHTSF